MSYLQVDNALSTTGQYIKDSEATPNTSALSIGTGRVGVGTSSPSDPLHIYHATDTSVAQFQSGSTRSSIKIRDTNDIAYVGTEATKAFIGPGSTCSTSNLIIDSSGNVGIGTTSPGSRLTVAGDVDIDSNTLFVDSTNNRVGIGTASPSKQLHVRGEIAIFDPDDNGHGSYISFDPYSTAHGRLLIENTDYLPGAVDVKIVGSTEIETLYAENLQGLNLVTKPVFTGTGLNDSPEAGGTYTGPVGEKEYRVEIDGTGSPNTFKWSDNGGSSWNATGVSITGSAQSLNYGVSISFNTTTGHTSGDHWDFTAKRTLPLNVGTSDLIVDDDGKVGIGTTSPNYELQVNGTIAGIEQSSDPTEPSEGEFIIWMSNGAGDKGDDGDVLIASKAGGATKWTTLFDHSTGSSW